MFCTLGGAFSCHQLKFFSNLSQRGVFPHKVSASKIFCFKHNLGVLSERNGLVKPEGSCIPENLFSQLGTNLGTAGVAGCGIKAGLLWQALAFELGREGVLIQGGCPLGA